MNNSTLIEPKEPKEKDKDFEDKSCDKNKKQRLRVIYKREKWRWCEVSVRKDLTDDDQEEEEEEEEEELRFFWS